MIKVREANEKILSVDEFKIYDKNSRTHSDNQIDQICASIQEFGITNPILIDENNQIIAGHGRLMAAKKLGLKSFPCVTLEGLTDSQKKACVIADNQLALNADWDLDLLRFEIEGLKDSGFDVDLIGFDGDFLDGLLNIDAELPDLPGGDKEPYQQKTFTLHDEQAAVVDDAVMLARKDPMCDSDLNENSNGNALAMICEEWLKMVGENG